MKISHKDASVVMITLGECPPGEIVSFDEKTDGLYLVTDDKTADGDIELVHLECGHPIYRDGSSWVYCWDCELKIAGIKRR